MRYKLTQADNEQAETLKRDRFGQCVVKKQT